MWTEIFGYTSPGLILIGFPWLEEQHGDSFTRNFTLVKQTALAWCTAIGDVEQTKSWKAHLTEVHGAVFSADVLFALVAGRLGLR